MNPHETLARQRKVAAIVAAIPAGGDDLANQKIANCFADLPPEDRAAFCVRRGISAPSSETWRLVIEQLRARFSTNQRRAS